MRAKPELLFSVDVEADGPIPGPYSMTSIGACVTVMRTDKKIIRFDVDAFPGFRADLAPISDTWDPEALAVGGKAREYFEEHGEDPKVVMERFATWVNDTAEEFGAVPRFAAYPAAYDWTWVYWYLMRFHGSSPFGFSGVLDMKTWISARKGAVLSKSTKKHVPRSLRSTRPHTHDPLDDAKEQAELLQNLLEWDGTYNTPNRTTGDRS